MTPTAERLITHRMRIVESHILEDVEPDVENNILRGVRILGHESANGRKYSDEAMSAAVHLYDGAPAYYDHQRGTGPRKTEDVAGEIQRPRYDRTKRAIYGDIILDPDPRRDKVLAKAHRYRNRESTRGIGLSHVADGEETDRVVTKINEVYSVDVVTDPATSKGLYEDTNPMSTPAPADKPKKTFREILDGAPETTKGRKLLVEMEQAGMVEPDAEVEVAPESSPEEQIKAGLMAAIIKKLETDSEAFQQVIELLELGDAVGAATSGEPTESEETSEAVKLAQRMNLIEAENALLKAGREATELQKEAVAAAPKTKWSRLIESWPAANADSQPAPRSTRPETVRRKEDTGASSAAVERLNARIKEARDRQEELRKKKKRQLV